MKILHTVEFYHPSVGGMQEVVKQLSERLVKLGHDVTVATTKLSHRNEMIINGAKIVDFDISGNLVRGLKGDVDSYKYFLLNSDFDIITNFAAQQWATDVMLTVLDKIKGKKVFVPTGFSGLYSPGYKDYFESMKVWMKQYDINVFLSDNYRDINFARENNVKNTLLIPNGAGEDEFLKQSSIDIRQKLNIPKSYFLILHVGSHTGLKGHQEAIDIFSNAKINNSIFLLVGNDVGGCYQSCKKKEHILNSSNLYKATNKRVIIASLSREETVAAYQASDLFLFPSNIECSPLVLFECMASKTPFLTTDVGNAKEIIKWSNSGILLPTIDYIEDFHIKDKVKNISKYMLAKIGIGFNQNTPKENFAASKAKIQESASILEGIYGNLGKRKLMAKAGFNYWQERFTWEKIASQYEQLYISLLKD